MIPGKAGHLTPASTLDEMVSHPAFAGFGRLLLPWDDRVQDGALPLRRIGTLLPYHSHVDADVVVAALNRMIDDHAAGRRIFHPIYNEAEQRSDPSKRNTGLFFLRGTPGAPFAVISPGGGFAYVGAVHEGFPYAQAVGARGYNAFVLRYRAGQGGRAPTEDLAAAISFIVRHAAELDVAVHGYSLWGSSAGARMAASIGSHGVEASGGGDVVGPATVVMAYTGHSDISPDEPPTFAVVGEQDGIARPEVMARRVAALQKTGTPVEFHRYPRVGHGFGVGAGTSAAGWIDDAVRFWEQFISKQVHP